MIKPSSNPWKNATWTLAILLILSLTGNWYLIDLRKDDKILAELNLAKSNTTIATKEAQIAMRQATIDSIRKDRSKDSLKATIDSRAFKSQIAKLRFKISQLPQQIVYNPDSATVDSLRVSFALKDSVIDTQALMIMNLETEKQGLFASFTREVQQLTDNRNDQIVITNQLQNQLVEEQGKTRKAERKKRFWRTVSIIGAGAVGVLLLSPK